MMVIQTADRKETLIYDKNGKKVEKKLQDYEISKPSQLTIFEFLDEENYSNTVDIFDLVPKFLNRNPRSNTGRLEPIKKYPVIKINGKDLRFQVTITPATIEVENGVFRDLFPTIREEVVELGIRKLAFSGQGKYFDKKAGALFTVTQLHKLLKEHKRGYDKSDIMQAIEVLKKTTIDIKCLDDDAFPRISVNYVSDSYTQTLAAYNKGVNDSKCFVIFNSMVTDSINQKTLRMYNYKMLMQYKNIIADHLHMRITRNMKYAAYNGKENVFRISQSTLERDTNMPIYENYRDNKRQVITALNKMKECGSVEEYWGEDEKEGKKTINTMYYLRISKNFCDEIIQANQKIDNARTPAEKIEHRINILKKQGVL